MILAQLVRTPVTNPPPKGELRAPPVVISALRSSCFDCHSSQTRWPWYSSVAPVSWLVAHDVARGRQELDFSNWSAMYPQARNRKLQWIERALTTENMPPLLYRVIHPAARVSAADRALIVNWIEIQLAQPDAANAKTK